MVGQAYEGFEKRLRGLLRASDEEDKTVWGEIPSYVLGYDDQMPTHLFLQALIADAVGGSAESASDRGSNRV